MEEFPDAVRLKPDPGHTRARTPEECQTLAGTVLEQLTATQWLEALSLTGPTDEQGFYAARELADGHWLVVEPQTFGRARVGISDVCTPTATGRPAWRQRLALRLGYGDVWDYGSREAAITAMEAWDGQGEPVGWIRHFPTGRRRTASGAIAPSQMFEVSRDQQLLAIVRRDVAAGAGHACFQWNVGGACLLCDRPIPELGPGEAAAAIARALESRRE